MSHLSCFTLSLPLVWCCVSMCRVDPKRVRPSSCVLSQELQLRVPVLQQHAALIGGPNATSCPICHKLFLGGEALMEHMKHTHKDPNASGVASKFPAFATSILIAWSRLFGWIYESLSTEYHKMCFEHLLLICQLHWAHFSEACLKTSVITACHLNLSKLTSWTEIACNYYKRQVVIIFY